MPRTLAFIMNYVSGTYFQCTSLLVVLRKYFTIFAVVILDLTIPLVLIFLDILMAVEQSKKHRIKDGSGSRRPETLYCILYNLAYLNCNELDANNWTLPNWHIKFVHKTWKIKPGASEHNLETFNKLTLTRFFFSNILLIGCLAVTSL